MNAQELLWKGAATASAIGAGIAARNLATSAWERQQGTPPPTNPADPTTSWGQALGWTVLVGAVVGAARLFARRGAAGVWASVNGELPPGVAGRQDDVDA